MTEFIIIIIIIIIIIKKGQQCKAEREWYTPYQSEDPSPPIERKKRKGNIVEDYSRDRAAYANKKIFALLLKPASPTPSNTGLVRSFQRDTERGIKVICGAARFCSEAPHKYTDVRPQHRV